MLRRTLPAMAITLGVFTILRLAIGQDLRSRYMPALTKIFSFLHRPALPKGSYWLVSGGVVSRRGQVLSTSVHGGPSISFGGVPVPVGQMPSGCQALVYSNPRQFGPCLAGRGYRMLITYQPAGRYWAFQGIEAGIFVFLAAALIAMTALVVIRRDA
jgi:hypothetical protein